MSGVEFCGILVRAGGAHSLVSRIENAPCSQGRIFGPLSSRLARVVIMAAKVCDWGFVCCGSTMCVLRMPGVVVSCRLYWRVHGPKRVNTSTIARVCREACVCGDMSVWTNTAVLVVDSASGCIDSKRPLRSFQGLRFDAEGEAERHGTLRKGINNSRQDVLILLYPERTNPAPMRTCQNTWVDVCKWHACWKRRSNGIVLVAQHALHAPIRWPFFSRRGWWACACCQSWKLLFIIFFQNKLRTRSCTDWCINQPCVCVCRGHCANAEEFCWCPLGNSEVYLLSLACALSPILS